VGLRAYVVQMCRGTAEEKSRRSKALKRIAQGWTVILVGGPNRRFLHIMIDVKLQLFNPCLPFVHRKK
jgi:hypothetical protein